VLNANTATAYSMQMRYNSNQRKTFLGGFFEQLKQDYNKNKEMKESIKKFREEAQKLEQSDALKEARKKYVRFYAHYFFF
jgi:import inner membrane translocase subunit TIM44